MSALTVIEGVIIAIVAGAMKNDIGWGIAAFIVFIVLYFVPVIGEAVSIMASLIEAMIVNELLNMITSNVMAWFISMFAFFVILKIHIKVTKSDIGILGYALIIFEAVIIGAALYLEYSLTQQAIIISIALMILSVIPIVRILEFIISALGTAYVFYIIASENIGSIYAIISSTIILLSIIGFYIAAYSEMDYQNAFKRSKISRKLKKWEKKYPQIKFSQECREILKRCRSSREKAEFWADWTSYMLTLERIIYASPKQQPEENVYSFKEWYDRNARWASTSYYHKYYEEQQYVEKCRLNQEDEALFTENKCEAQNFQNKSIPAEPIVDKADPIEEQYSLLNFIDGFSLKEEMIKNDEAESIVYSTLESFINEKYIIIPHVGFRELFTWDWQKYYKITDRVTKMHFDFVIFTRNFMPVLVIEVWGKMHEEDPKVIERDIFKQRLLEKCSLNLVKIDVSKSMPNEKIKELTIQSIKDAIPDREKYTVYCPKCKAIMKIKPNRKKGTMFYGCSRFPKCKGSQSISDVPPLYDGIALKVE